MTLAELDKGAKVDCHVTLYETEMAVIDDLAQRFNCSRAAIIGAWSREYASTDLTDKLPAVAPWSARARRPGAGRKPIVKKTK